MTSSSAHPPVHDGLYLSDELLPCLNKDQLFAQACKLKGEVFREVASRRTLKFQCAGRAYFVKLHFGVGWKEIMINLLQLRLPVLGARNEWQAARKLARLGIDTLTPVAFSSHGNNPANIHSCLITRALENTLSLEEMFEQGLLGFALRRIFVVKLAEIAAVMHHNGINHRDFYLCHFLVDQGTLQDAAPRVYVIDLHRAQLRARTPDRWRIKDISGLLYSGIDAGLTRSDVFRFVQLYAGKTLRRALLEDGTFWRQVVRRAINLYQKDHARSSNALRNLTRYCGVKSLGEKRKWELGRIVKFKRNTK